MKFSLLSLLLVVTLTACSGINTIQGGGESKTKVSTQSFHYSENYTKKLAAAKELYRKGQADKAIASLKVLKESDLNPLEKSARDNLFGVIAFSRGKFDDALKSFEKALPGSESDSLLSAQVHLNLAGSYYKKGFGEKAYEVISRTPYQVLRGEELKKYHLLSARLAKDLNKEEEELGHLVSLTQDKKSVAELKGDAVFERLRGIFSKRDLEYKLKFITRYETERPLAIGYLAYETAEQAFYTGNKDKTNGLIDWVKEFYATSIELQDLIKVLSGRIENFSKIDLGAVGVVLPLTGDKKDFSERILQGIDVALNAEGLQPVTLHTKDSQGSGPTGAIAVKELIAANNVAVIIGGLFPDEATNEYLEARKNGVLFISLSSIYLPKEQKDHLLLEIPGSIESQMKNLFAQPMVNSLGKRAAIVYPKGARGEAYVEEFWRRAQLAGVEVNGVTSFEKDLTDYRDTVKGILELKYKRERQEELDILSGVQSLEKNNTKRVQVLGPIVDFDWVFLPALPREALQIIPAFGYFDATRLSYIGDASWRSQLMSREGGRMDRLYFVADDLDPNEQVFSKAFAQKFGTEPKLLEYIGFDSLRITQNILTESKATSRDELDLFVKGKVELMGLTGKWKLEEGVWMKDLGIYAIKRGKIENFNQVN